MKRVFIICLIILISVNIAYAYSIQGDFNSVTEIENKLNPLKRGYSYKKIIEEIGDEDRLRLCRLDEKDEKWYAIEAEQDKTKKKFIVVKSKLIKKYAEAPTIEIDAPESNPIQPVQKVLLPI